MRAKTIKTTVVAIVASFAILGAGCGSTAHHAAQTGRPSVAQIQAYLNEQLNPHPAPTPSSQLPPNATEVEREIAKGKESARYPIPYINSQTSCIDEGAGKFKCLTTYGGKRFDGNELTNTTCSQSLPLHCIHETTNTNASSEEEEAAGASKISEERQEREKEAPASAGAEEEGH